MPGVSSAECIVAGPLLEVLYVGILVGIDAPTRIALGLGTVMALALWAAFTLERTFEDKDESATNP